MVLSAAFQVITPSNRVRVFPGRQISAVGIHFWRMGRYVSRSTAGRGRAMFRLSSMLINNEQVRNVNAAPSTAAVGSTVGRRAWQAAISLEQLPSTALTRTLCGQCGNRR